jgi:hypothetical protein
VVVVGPETVTVRYGSYEPERDVAAERAEYLLAQQEWEQGGRQGEPPAPPKPNASARQLVPLGRGKWMWSPMVVTYDDKTERPVVAELEIVTGGDGRPRATRIVVRARDDGGEVNAETLRIPVAEIIRYTVAVSNVDGPDAEPGTPPPRGGVFTIGETVSPVPVPRRKTARTKENLRQVVDVYQRTAWGNRGQAVADALDVTIHTARNLISRARREGLFDEEGKEEE